MMLTLLLAAMASASPPPAPTAGEPRACPNPFHYAQEGRRGVYRRLDRLPPGRLELTVLRSLDGCPEPVVLREGIGGAPAAPRGRPNR